MKRSDLKLPLFTVSPKTYLLADDSIAAADLTDEIAKDRDHSIFLDCYHSRALRSCEELKFAIPTAQHADLIGDGKRNGTDTFFESLKSAESSCFSKSHGTPPDR